MINITVLTLVDRISSFYSLYPFFTNTDKKYSFTWTADASWCINSDKNQIIILMRQFIKPDIVDISLLTRLRQKYKRIAFFHDDAGGGIPRLEVLPFVDLFYCKALFKDKSLYKQELYGKELYSDYYHTKYGIVDPDSKKRSVIVDESQLNKLRLSWNIGIGMYPRRQLRQRAGVFFSRLIRPDCARFFYTQERFNPAKAVESNKALYQVHARMGLISRPSISYQRTIILDKISSNPLFLTGMVNQSQFNHETKHSRIIISPFGWGELCLRDFEAVRSGALLIKPDMSHLETWPDIFHPDTTYVPINWEATDLLEKTNIYLQNESKRKTIVRNAADVYYEALKTLQHRFSLIMGEITEGIS